MVHGSRFTKPWGKGSLEFPLPTLDLSSTSIHAEPIHLKSDLQVLVLTRPKRSSSRKAPFSSAKVSYWGIALPSTHVIECIFLYIECALSWDRE